jgi:hypothetical protein
MSRVSPQGTVLTWGTTRFLATSISVSASAGNEIDITSMSSEIVTDPENTNRKLVKQDFDSCFATDGGEVSIEFFAPTGNWIFSSVGMRKTMTLRFPIDEKGTIVLNSTDPNMLGIVKTAVMTQAQISATTGDFIRGSATFRLSNR